MIGAGIPKAQLMDSETMARVLTRMAHEIMERAGDLQDLILVGIRRRGVPLAERIGQLIEQAEGPVPVGTLDITFYRDDLSLLSEHPQLKGTDVPADVNGKNIVLIDDVLYTGRTARAAMEAVMDMGRANSIQLAVLIDRGHRELPIRADYVGKNVPTSRQEMVRVCVKEFDGVESVELYGQEG